MSDYVALIDENFLRWRYPGWRVDVPGGYHRAVRGTVWHPLDAWIISQHDIHVMCSEYAAWKNSGDTRMDNHDCGDEDRQ